MVLARDRRSLLTKILEFCIERGRLRAERNVSIGNIARIAKGLQVEPWKQLLKDD
jgi:hypothetical protein